MNVDTDLTPFTKINSKWIIGVNVKHKTMKLLEDYIGENLYGFGFGYDFLHTTPKAWSRKETRNWTLLKFKTSALQNTQSRE